MQSSSVALIACLLLVGCDASVSTKQEGAASVNTETVPVVGEESSPDQNVPVGLELRYHHTGLPAPEAMEGEVLVEPLGLFVSGLDASEYGVEWTRRAENSIAPAVLDELAHIAFEVDDLDAAIAGQSVLMSPVSVRDGVEVAFIDVDGFPVELIEIDETVAGDYSTNIEYVYHSIWQPRSTPHEKDVHLEDLKMYAASRETEFGVGWVRYYEDAPYPESVKTYAHVVFDVPDIQAAIADRKIIIEANNPSPGLWVAFVEENGAPIEFIEQSADAEIEAVASEE